MAGIARPHARAGDRDGVQVARPLGQLGDRQGVVADAALQLGLARRRRWRRQAGAAAGQAVDRDGVAADAGERRRPGRVAEAERVREGGAADPGRGPARARRGRAAPSSKRSFAADRRALGSVAVLQPDLGRVGAGRGGDAQVLDRRRRPVERRLADRDLPGGVEHAVVDRGDRPGRVAPAQGERALRRASSPRRRRRSGRAAAGARSARRGTRRGQRAARLRWQRASHRVLSRRSHGPNSPAAEPLEDASPPLAAGGSGAGAGGGGSYSTAPVGGFDASVLVLFRSTCCVAGFGCRLGRVAAPARERVRTARPRWLAPRAGAARIARSPACARAAGVRSSGAGSTPVATQAAAPPAAPAQSASSLARAAMPAPRGAAGAGDLGRGRVAGAADARQARAQPGDQLVRPLQQRARGRQHRRQRDRDPRRRPVGAHGRAAAGAGAQVLAHRRRVARARLAVAEGREQRPQLAAAAAVLAAGDAGRGSASRPSARHAVDFGLAEAGQLADLGVGVALGEQAQRPQLGRLQRLQRLAAAGDRLAPLDLLRRARRRPPGSAPPSRRRRLVVAAAGSRAAARGSGARASASCLVTVWVQRISSRGSVVGALVQDDLQRPLVGVLGVLGIERVAPRGPPQRGLVPGDHFDRGPLARGVARWAAPVGSSSCAPRRRRLPSPGSSPLNSPTDQIRGRNMPSQCRTAAGSPPFWTSDRCR